MSTHLILCVAVDSPANRRIARAIRNWCDRQLGGRYRLEICDLRDRPAFARQIQALATPLLVLKSPPVRVLGDLADVPRVMATLGLPPGSG